MNNLSYFILVLSVYMVANGEIRVGQNANSQYKSIQEAIDNAPSSSVIHINSGVYNENIVISKPMSLFGDESETSCILIKSNPETPAILVKANNVNIQNIRIKNSKVSGGTGIVLDGVNNCIIRNNCVGYLGPFSTALVLKNGSAENTIDSNFIQGSGGTIGITSISSHKNIFTSNIMDYGWELFDFKNCSKGDNVFLNNNLQSKNMSGRLKDDTTTNSYSLKMSIPMSEGRFIEKTINPSGWEDQGKFIYREIWDFCSVSSNTKVLRYWEIGNGGSKDSSFSVAKTQGSLDSIWGKLEFKPEKPKIDYNKSCLIVIQPGQSITQYNYKVSFQETAGSIIIAVNEFHTPKASNILIGQNPIFAYEIPISVKPIQVNILRCPGSNGPYPL